ncbi:MAG TPA: hypothetical protein PLZ15_02450 [Melioribacteraceae bacterium]|nr:hypothetical protein [Melioribacteraceae bacterium]
MKTEQIRFYFLLGLYLLSVLLTVFINEARYIRYLIPYIGILLIYSIRVEKLFIKQLFATIYLQLIIFMIAFSFVTQIILNGSLYPRLFEEAFFILSPSIFVFALFHFEEEIRNDKVVDIIFIVLSCAYLIEYAQYFTSFSFKNILGQLIFAKKADTESPLAFSFGLFFLYFMHKRNYKFLLIAAFFTIFSYKRIVLAGVIVSAAVYYLLTKADLLKAKKIIVNFALGINLLVLILLILFANGYFNQIIFDLTGIPPNLFTKGRLAIFGSIINNPENNVIFGIGLGKTSAILKESILFDVNLMHSDLLKIYMEFGIIVYILFIYVLYKNLTISVISISLAVYMNILFLTDNVWIYFPTQFIFLLLATYESLNYKLNIR